VGGFAPKGSNQLSYCQFAWIALDLANIESKECIVRYQLRMVLRDRLGQCLVGLKREQEIGSLRDLGLVCLTGGLVRRTRHR
jgi:hypothetical protein